MEGLCPLSPPPAPPRYLFRGARWKWECHLKGLERIYLGQTRGTLGGHYVADLFHLVTRSRVVRERPAWEGGQGQRGEERGIARR